MDMSNVVRFVDDYLDNDPKTRNSSPGKVFGHNLILIGKQIERRPFRQKRVKHLIFQEEGTRNIWYKNTFDYPSIVAMGFSTSKLTQHPKAVPMEQYARYFIDRIDEDWIKRNDFELVDIERICRVILSDDKKTVTFESATGSGSTLEEKIAGDVKYGKMIPKNGKYFTYRVESWNGKWISNEQIRKGVTIVWNRIEKIIDIECREVTDNEYADFIVQFHTVETDPRKQLTKNTLQYHFYPISDFNNPNRGVCVVNAAYPWTVDGVGIPLHIFDPVNYPKPVTSTAETIDFDSVYEHEADHGLGLPHSDRLQTKMYGNYNGMIEHTFDENPKETEPRLQAKYPKEILSQTHTKRWQDFFRIRSDKY